MRLFLPVILSALLASCAKQPQPPHDDAPAAPAATATAGPVRLTQMMVQNLGLETAEAELKPMEKAFSALGTVHPEPGKVAAIASRVAGRVTRLNAREGQPVKAGEPLFEVESRVVADPPPRITLKAPLDGVVLESSVVPGGTVEPDRNLATIVDLSAVEVIAQVFEAQIGSVSPGQTVRIQALAYPDLTFTGKVKATGASLDRETNTMRVFVHVENPDGRLRLGMRCRLTFVLEQTDDAVVVPRAAVLGEAGDLFVYRQVTTAPFAYERTPVVTGLRGDRDIEIIEGVLPGDRVVTRGNYQLQYVGDGGGRRIDDDHGHTHGPGGHQH